MTRKTRALGDLNDARLRAFELFKDAAKNIWSNHDFVLPYVVLSSEEPVRDVLASLAYTGTPMAVGNSIFRRPQRYVLRISGRLLAMADDAIYRVMVHEAVHLGYPRHDIAFRHMVRQHGGTMSESAIDNPGVHVQKKVGSRYLTLRTFVDEKEATAWAREQMQLAPGRYRFSLGAL